MENLLMIKNVDMEFIGGLKEIFMKETFMMI